MNGAQGRDRTTDTAIFNRMLYQLSYLGAGHRSGSKRPYRQADRPAQLPNVPKPRQKETPRQLVWRGVPMRGF